jgi:hypothetical protein
MFHLADCEAVGLAGGCASVEAGGGETGGKRVSRGAAESAEEYRQGNLAADLKL